MNAAMETQPTTTTVDFPRFGSLTYAADEVLEFPWGLPGFARLRHWLALTLPTQANFVWLQSLDDPAVAIPTCDPWMVFESYEPKLPGYAIAALDIANPSDFTMLCVVVAADGGQEMTMNLLAPIVVNLRSRRARQIMLETSGYSVKEPMPQKSADSTDGAGTPAATAQ
jgi:flagellar assembly factor FliW